MSHRFRGRLVEPNGQVFLHGRATYNTAATPCTSRCTDDNAYTSVTPRGITILEGILPRSVAPRKTLHRGINHKCRIRRSESRGKRAGGGGEGLFTSSVAVNVPGP